MSATFTDLMAVLVRARDLALTEDTEWRATRLTGPRESLWWEASEVPYTAESERALTLAQQAADGEFGRHVRPIDLLRGLLGLEEEAWQADAALVSAQQAGINLLDLRAKVLATGTV